MATLGNCSWEIVWEIVLPPIRRERPFGCENVSDHETCSLVCTSFARRTDCRRRGGGALLRDGDRSDQHRFGGHQSVDRRRHRLHHQANHDRPGGSTGWHYHDGRVFGVVREGTLTRTMADCKDVVDPAGAAVTEGSGADHAHNGRNLGPVPVVLWVDYIQPAGAPLAVDVPPPPGCAV